MDSRPRTGGCCNNSDRKTALIRVQNTLTRLRRQIGRSRSATLTLWLLVSQLLAAGVSFVVNIIAAYGLEPEQRGLLAFYLQIGYLLTTFVLLGTEKPFFAKVEATFSVSTALFLRVVRPAYFLITAIALITVTLFVFGFASIAAPMALVTMFIICNQHLRIVRAAYISSGSLKPFLAVIVVTNGLTLIFALILAAMQQGNFLVWLLAYVVANFIATFCVARAAAVARHDELVNTGPVQQIRRHGLRLLPASLGNIALFRPDRLLLPILASPADLGVYIVVSAALEVAVWPVQQWADSKMSEWHHSKPYLDQRLKAAILVKAALGVLLLSILCAAFLVVVVIWMLPDEYNASLGLLVPITLANIIFGTTRVQQGIAITGHRSGLVSSAEVSGLLVSVASYFALIPMFGGLGAAVGSIIGNTVCFAITEIGIRTTRQGS